MKRKFPMVTVAVDADRRNGIKEASGLPERKGPKSFCWMMHFNTGMLHRHSVFCLQRMTVFSLG